MHGEGARDGLGDGEELGDDGWRGRGAVVEGQVGDGDALALELVGAVVPLVEPHDDPARRIDAVRQYDPGSLSRTATWGS